MTNWNIPHVQTIGFIHLHSWWVFHWRANVSSPRGLWKFSGTPKATCRQRFPMLFSGGNSPCPRNLFCRNLSYLISVASFFFFFSKACVANLWLTNIWWSWMSFFQFFWMFLFLLAVIGHFFWTFCNNGSEIKDNKADDGLFRGLYINSSNGWIYGMGVKNQSLFLHAESSDIHLQLGGGSRFWMFTPFFVRNMIQWSHTFISSWVGFNHLKGSNPSLKWDQDLLSKVFHGNFKGPFLLDAHLVPLANHQNNQFPRAFQNIFPQ